MGRYALKTIFSEKSEKTADDFFVFCEKKRKNIHQIVLNCLTFPHILMYNKLWYNIDGIVFFVELTARLDCAKNVTTKTLLWRHDVARTGQRTF